MWAGVLLLGVLGCICAVQGAHSQAPATPAPGAPRPTVPPGHIPCPAGSLCPQPVLYPQGWNLIAAPRGPFPVTVYGWTGDSPDYTAVAPRTLLQPGAGYWAFLDQSTVVEVSKDCSGSIPRPDAVCTPPPLRITLPAGQFELIGNPAPLAVTVDGADVIYTYDPTAQRYVQGDILEIGQGAWAYSAAGGSVTFDPVLPPYQ